MDRIIRHKRHGRYLTASGKWVRDINLAQAFYFVADAREFCLAHGIFSGVECVMFCGAIETVFEIFDHQQLAAQRRAA